MQKELADLKKKTESPDLWKNPQEAQQLLREEKKITTLLEEFLKMEAQLNTIEDFFELFDESGDEEIEKELIEMISDAEKSVEAMKIKLILNDRMDPKNAILTISPGAGGTEAQDWAQMLMRMYIRWAEKHGYNTKILDLQLGEEAGIKNVTLLISGEYAYGYLKGESGVHRLVRISPFDANKRRHTSFAAVSVTPEIEDDIEIDVKETDLRIDTFRASGAGGQHVNRTDSAVRIVHIPTGIVVQCQNERSQHQNKAIALKILKSKLYQLEMKKREEKLQEIRGEKKEIAWGSQIRSYILQPYQMVKDHRTGVEIGNVNTVLDGEIDKFIKAYLTSHNQKGKGEKNGKNYSF